MKKSAKVWLLAVIGLVLPVVSDSVAPVAIQAAVASSTPVMIKEINTGPSSFYLYESISANGKLFFVADDKDIRHLLH